MRMLIVLTFLLAIVAPVAADDTIYLPIVINSGSSGTIPLATSTPTRTSAPPTATSTRLPPTPTRTLEPPTATLTPTPTNSPTPTPTATATADVTVLANHSYSTTMFGSLYIFGEVRNNSTDNIRFTSLTADLFDGNQQLVDTDQGYAQREIIPPGQTSCFRVLFFNQTATWATYQLSAEASTTTEQPIALTITSTSANPNSDDYELIGQVRNDSGVEQKFVKIIGTLYDSNNTVIDCDYTYANTETLAPGATSSWKINFFGTDRERVASHAVVPD